MGCKTTNRKTIKSKIEEVIEFNPNSLTETGRVQYFYHCPESALPIRDVLKRQKTEPHIEIGAENFLVCCYQENNIVPFLRDREKYLFLFTTCKNESLKGYYNKRFIVGYIINQTSTYRDCTKLIKQGYLACKCNVKQHWVVRGKTRLYSFEDAYPLEKLVSNPMEIRMLKIYEPQKILDHFKGKKNILDKCIKAIIKLDKENETCLKEGCEFYKNKDCLRWSIA